MANMIALTGCLAVILIALLLAPQTPFARLCHRQLVERPASALAKFRPHHIIYAVILIPVMLSGGEFIALLGPEFFAAYAMELAIYVDAVIVSVLASTAASIKAFAGSIRQRFNRLSSRKSARTKRAARKPQRDRMPANYDEHVPAMPMAA
ncbi:hypothetical protein [Aurantiacibacter sediminis]|nr:hypothetical protein [Aurantiacibacter sediminis]